VIDITMTATLRADLVEQTLESFTQNLFAGTRGQYRLIVNVDPTPLNASCSPMDVVCVVKSFSQTAHCRISKRPSFLKAMMWCWGQTQSELVLNLEDDWTLNRKVDIQAVLQHIRDHDEHYMVRFSKNTIPQTLETHAAKWRVVDGVLENDGEAYYSNNPAIIRRSFMESVLPLVNRKWAFETQLRHDDVNPNQQLKELMKEKKYCLWAKPGDKSLVTDIGTAWRNARSIGKSKDKRMPLRWV